ncbi:hypothetical protein LEP1GSC088_0709 [Leptospira interrogans str. L1207]|uniref:Uncharacterized protein n=2 Tax=Leptospira interrogans TaxID=173 RepID=A0A0F6HG94_LEPIR|nr:hypothetical protein LEP1GSC104_2077 [Leptospira interrogans str. UI 12621]EKR17302.1 hypothetical protein LEP1GSC019_3587 [Leptospira interrogans serovar Pyrogenes str. 2006006960]EKR28487.1 hypothetical protein LEP1GSC087_1819 [Leptospira interrogans serovar Bataviae str. L1111]EMM94793.1 hypothetical protein LEP1GSC158_2108 [Leptospira interrogans serovar Zanoni str. LT2156]EMN46925.1 hypothetical protein LEP1GSC088_0709 [Leptospira interrogans str. L1207]EMN52338.1 hypothetical protein 
MSDRVGTQFLGNLNSMLLSELNVAPNLKISSEFIQNSF